MEFGIAFKIFTTVCILLPFVCGILFEIIYFRNKEIEFNWADIILLVGLLTLMFWCFIFIIRSVWF